MGAFSRRVEGGRLGTYTYWVDQEVFKPLDKVSLKNKFD